MRRTVAPRTNTHTHDRLICERNRNCANISLRFEHHLFPRTYTGEWGSDEACETFWMPKQTRQHNDQINRNRFYFACLLSFFGKTKWIWQAGMQKVGRKWSAILVCSMTISKRVKHTQRTVCHSHRQQYHRFYRNCLYIVWLMYRWECLSAVYTLRMPVKSNSISCRQRKEGDDSNINIDFGDQMRIEKK